MRKRKGFTLMELIIVVIIIGILAMIGLPQYFKTTERAKMSEALDILGTIRSAQLRYSMANNGNSTADWTQLDIDEPGTLKFFGKPDIMAVVCDSNSTSNATEVISTSAGYTVGINCRGNITCNGQKCPPVPK